MVTAPLVAASTVLVPVTIVAAGATAVSVVSAAVAPAPAKAATGTALILSTSVNGGSSSAEAQAATNLGLTVTVATPTTWDAMTQAQFANYTVIIIGDPSTSTSCSTTAPADALSSAGTWGPAVDGNVSVLGTAPALAGATTLITDSIAYAASGASGTTGLYVSLNCEDSTATAGTSIPLLASVDGGGFTATGQSASCPSNAGTVNTWEALALTQFNGIKTANLGPWSSPACSVEETLTAWPAGLAGVAYDTAASPASFTASDGATGQAYIVAGVPASTSTAALAPSTGGEIPAGSTAGGGSNDAAPGVSQESSAGVNTESGDYSTSASDLSIPTFGPSLDFSRTYDAQTAQQQTQTATPGPMGYGWTDNWATSLASAKPVPDDIYSIAGLRTNNNNGGSPTSQPAFDPGDVLRLGGNTYISDTEDNRVLEIAGATGTQWGISMTAGDEYVIAGSPTGAAGDSPNGTAMASSKLNWPMGLASDSAGDLFVADFDNSRILEFPIASGTNYGISMTADDVYTIAGNWGGSQGHSGDGGPATSAFLSEPQGVAVNSSGVYIADTDNNRIQEVAAASGSQWGQSMTANDIYTVAGNSAGNSGISGNGTAATSALLSFTESISLSSSGDLYIADSGNNRILELPQASGTQWGISMTGDDIYTIAGSATGASGSSGDGGVATSAKVNQPWFIEVDNGTQLYIADTNNNKIREVARSTHTEWGQSMTANDIYTIAGTGTAGFSGDGGAATSATLNAPAGFGIDGSFNIYVADANNNRIREISSSSFEISEVAGNGYTLSSTGDSGSAVGSGLESPDASVADAQGDIYIDDFQNNRIQEIAASTHTQWGIAMTAGNIYTVAGSATGSGGNSGNLHLATSALLADPSGLAVDSAGDLYIADSGNNQIREVAASTHSQWGQSMTANDIYTVAGSTAGTSGNTGIGGAATSATLNDPVGIAADSAGDLYVIDNCQVKEIFNSGGQAWGQSMTSGNIYSVAGSLASCFGSTGDGGPATAASFNQPYQVAVDGAGNLYVADGGNNRVQEIAATTHAQWGQAMTKYDIYTVAGPASGEPAGTSGDGGPARNALLSLPRGVTVDSSGDVYIADTDNNRVQEIAGSNGTQWGQSMTAGDIYTVVGSASGHGGNSGNGGPATSALITTDSVAVDPAGDLFVSDYNNNQFREVAATSSSAFPVSPLPGGDTITQPDASQVTFYPVGSGCTGPYTAVPSGQFCTLPQYVGANLSYSSGSGNYTFTPQPGQTSVYNSAGQLISESDAAGDTLTATYGVTLPGSGNCPAAASWCQVITSASGRSLTVGYNGSNLVTSVTDPMSLRWTYAYSGNDLTSATDPMGNVTSYTYGAGSTGNPLNANNLVSITKPNAQPGGPDAGDAATLVYNAAGQVISETDPMGFETTYTWSGFNPATGNGVVSVADPDGNKSVYFYSQGTVAAQSSWTGSTLASEQDFVPDQTANGISAGTQLQIAAADGDGNISTTSYDSNGNPVSETEPDGVGSQIGTSTEQSTVLGQPICQSSVIASSTCSGSAGPSPVSPGGVITPPSAAPPLGETWTLYDTDGNTLYTTIGVYEPGSPTAAYSQTSYQLFKGNSVTLSGTNISCASTPPSQSLPCATINANGVVTQLTYNAQGDLISSATPDGNGSELATMTISYNGDGQQVSTTSPDGNLAGAIAANFTTTTAYNDDGEVTSSTEAGGSGATVTPRTTRYQNDADGNQSSVTDARGYTTTTTYNADDESTLVTDPDGNATLTCYDGFGRAVQTVPAVGVSANSLTPASCPTDYPAGYDDRLASDATVSTFNALGQKTKETTPAPAGQSGYETATYTYDANGNETETTGPPTSNGGGDQITVNTYNSAGELASSTAGYGTSAASTVSNCYDPDGNTTSVVYANGNASGVAPCSSSSPWTVSATAHPTQAAYQTTYSYDSADELVSTTAPATTAAPSGATATTSYDPMGNELTAKDPNGVTATWTYGPLNKVATISYSGSAAHSVSYGYDANGNDTSMTDATGSSTNTYDSFNELTSATNGAGQVTGYDYNADGAVSSITYPLPTGATWAASDAISYGYDHADSMTSVTDFNGNQISVTNTADGLPSSETLGSTGDVIATTYDPTDTASAITLKNATSTLQSFTYADVPSGDVLSETDTPTSAQSPADYTYDAQGRITSMTPGTGSTLNYGFDPSGNLTALPSAAAGTYDDAGELTSSVLSGTTTSYTYNADGERLTAKQGSLTSASAGWNGAGQLTSYDNVAANMSAAGYGGNGLRASTTVTPTGGSAVTQGYVWDTDTGIPQLLMDSSNAYIYTGDTTPAEQVNLSTGTRTYLVTDSLGSVRGTVNSSGALTATTNYDAWGNPETAGGLSSFTPFGYAGGYTDKTGLIYLISRYYDPSSGQFISLDPDVSQTLQPYSYTAGDPTVATDPTGACGGCRYDYSHVNWDKTCAVSWINGCVYDGGLLGALYAHRTTVYGMAAAWSVNMIGGYGHNTLCGPEVRYIFYPAGRSPHEVIRKDGPIGPCLRSNTDFNDWRPIAPWHWTMVPNFYDNSVWYGNNGDRDPDGFVCAGCANYYRPGTEVDIQLWRRRINKTHRNEFKDTWLTIVASGPQNEGVG